mgnify:CR=1 FL=1
MDVEILLKGAEKLGEVYVLEGAKEKIAALRARHARVTASLSHYEGKVARQARELERMNRPDDWEGEETDNGDEEAQNGEDGYEEVEIKEEDLRREEEEIKELERKKRELEDRVSGMERDLGGLLR